MNQIIFIYLHNLANQSFFLDWLIIFSSNLFGMIMLGFAIIFLFFHRDGVFDYRQPFLQLKNKIKEISLVFLSGVVAWAVSAIIKYIVMASRPFIVYENLKPLFLHGALDSFPSGHATFFMALAVSLFLKHRRFGAYYIIVALIVSLARVIAGIHFPIDILFGWILGALIAFIFGYIFQKKKRKKEKK
jgi:undecaprenyl-diphosphatase